MMIRIKDNYFDKLYEKPVELERLDHYFLPEAKINKYKLDEARYKKLLKAPKMRKIIKPGIDEVEFNHILKEALSRAYNVSFDE